MSQTARVMRTSPAGSVAANGATTDGTSPPAVVHPPIPISEALQSRGPAQAPATGGRRSSTKHVLEHPATVIPEAAPVADARTGFDYPTVLRGSTPHFNVYYDPSLALMAPRSQMASWPAAKVSTHSWSRTSRA
jgi:hypothetical protein